MDLTILVPLLVVLAGLIFVQRRQKQQAKAAVDEEKKGRGKRAAARSAGKKAASVADRPAAVASSSEPEEVEVSEDWGWEAVPDVEAEEAAANVAQEVDALTEYKVYKQFGYHEKAAESLSQYLTSGSAAVSDGMRSTLVNELVQLWLDAKKPDELAETLRQFGNLLTKAQTEDYIKQGLAVDKNNLNLRVLAENQWLTDLDHLTEPLAHHERRVTVHFTTQIATTREFNRHRANSMAEQSTRYCNYSKDKFGNEISINIPEWVRALSVEEPTQIDFLELAKKVTEGQADDYENWLFANLAAERAYMNLIALGRKPQEARAILPLATNTELIHTAFVSDWKHFFDLRAQGTTGAPHPDAKVLALPLYDEFCRLGLIEA